MFDSIKRLFGIKTVDYKELVKNGAKIIDVRSRTEFKSGHLKSATCIPIEVIQNEMKKLKKDDIIICYCRSGARSGMARRILKANGYTNVYNGGSMIGLQNKLRN